MLSRSPILLVCPPDPLAANDVYDPCGGLRATLRAHKDIQGGVRAVGPSRMDARGVIGLLDK